jgi:hypothetical protein
MSSSEGSVPPGLKPVMTPIASPRTIRGTATKVSQSLSSTMFCVGAHRGSANTLAREPGATIARRARYASRVTIGAPLRRASSTRVG